MGGVRLELLRKLSELDAQKVRLCEERRAIAAQVMGAGDADYATVWARKTRTLSGALCTMIGAYRRTSAELEERGQARSADSELLSDLAVERDSLCTEVDRLSNRVCVTEDL